ncbi:MAG: hypothetical protein A2X94_06830 [Bdellovibrionales bacterium GWB1_55_8]|nr:MAG: hypothetical protein A2X94_06830 [Bdellovibrionales bacterium GWB1_55_8]
MRLLRTLAVMVFLAAAVMTVLASAETPAPSAAGSAGAAESSGGDTTETNISSSASGACLTDPSVIEDLRKQREALQVRERNLVAKEAEFKAREDAIAEELKKFDGIRKELAKVQESRKSENDERVNKLVETFETMSPKAASQLLTSLDETLAVSAMSRISTQRLAKIMNLMDPAKSSRLTELLAGVVRANDSAPKERGTDASSDAAVTTHKERR